MKSTENTIEEIRKRSFADSRFPKQTPPTSKTTLKLTKTMQLHYFIHTSHFILFLHHITKQYLRFLRLEPEHISLPITSLTWFNFTFRLAFLNIFLYTCANNFFRLIFWFETLASFPIFNNSSFFIFLLFVFALIFTNSINLSRFSDIDIFENNFIWVL